MKFTTATLGVAAIAIALSSPAEAAKPAKPAPSSSPAPAAAAAAPSGNKGSNGSACAKQITLSLTNVYENGDTKFHYDNCENDHDGRGWTAGIAGFTTGTGDAWVVIQEYHKLTGGKDEFAKYDKVLKQLADKESGNISQLGGYCALWKKLGQSDAKFRAAQEKVRDSMYYNPSQKLADQLGAKLDVTRGQIYDTTIQHGEGTDKDSVNSLIKRTNAAFTTNVKGSSGNDVKVNGHSVDEIVWLNKFFEVRTADLKNPANKESQKTWAESVSRVKSYQGIVKAGTFTWDKPIKAPDNDGKSITISCGKN
ncbi:hypothetical protein GGI12_003056 [Dipsacomyces acuminosporus]|nr:hypothetical protein GGI12_003056 [Dipsacomyces acuminosporus]